VADDMQSPQNVTSVRCTARNSWVRGCRSSAINLHPQSELKQQKNPTILQKNLQCFLLIKTLKTK